MKGGKNLVRRSFTLFIIISLVLFAFLGSQFTFIHSVHGHPGSTKVFVDPPSVLPPDAPTPEEGGKITLRPDGDGNYTEWTGSYADWDDADPHDEDVTYVSVTAKDKSQSSTLEDPPTTETWEIASVKVIIFAKTNVSAKDDLVAPTLVIEGTEWVGEENLLGLDHVNYKIWTNEWGKNPATKDFWTWEEVSHLEAGVRSKLAQYRVWKGEIRVTQLYVEVSGPRFTVDIHVEDVEDLWQYLFEMFYNPDIIQGVWVNPNAPVEIGPFLSSDGGTINRSPGSGWNDTIGMLSLTGAYLAEMTQAKCPVGDGVLSTVIFKVVRKGETDLILGEKTALWDYTGTKIIEGRAYVADGYFRNIASDQIPTADFTYAAVSPAPVPLEGYNVTFTDTSTATSPKTISVRRWYFWSRGLFRKQLAIRLIESQSSVTRNFTVRGNYNVTLNVFDSAGVVGSKSGYLTIKAHDVYIIDITTSARRGILPTGPRADIGETVEITVVAENQGDFTETFDVSCFWSAYYELEWHYGSIGTARTVTNLGAGATKNLTFYWDTEGCNVTHAGSFTLHANASRVPYEYDVEWASGKLADNQYTGAGHRVRFHDVALTELTPSEETVTPGEIVQVEVTVTNEGDFNETDVVVRTWAQKGEEPLIDVGTKTIPLMTNKSFSDAYMKTIYPFLDNYTTTLTFDWNTSAVSAGDYTIRAEASVAPVEYHITNNVINRAAPQWTEHEVDWDDVPGKDFDIRVLTDATSIETVSNVDGSEEEKAISFDISGPSGTTRYCYLAVPKDALKGYPCLVLLDGVDITLDDSTFIRQSTTHLFFYFTCEFASPSTVQIFGPNSYPVDFPEGDPIEYYVGIASDSAVSGFGFSISEGFESGNVTFRMLPIGGYCAVGIPTELLEPDYTVYLDGVSEEFTMKSNLTHNFLYLPDRPEHVIINGHPVDDTFPSITDVSQTPLEDNVLAEDDVEVSATVTDTVSGVKGVTLNYTSGGGTWTAVDMTNVGGSVWSATIPAFPYCTSVTYIVIAEDNSGNIITTEEMGYEYGYHVIPEFPTWASMLLILVLLTVAIAIYKRRLLKAPIH